MKISYRRTGGFAGMVMSFNIGTEALPTEEGQALQDLVAAADFFDLPARITSQEPGADQFQYRVTVEAGQRQHTVEVGEAAVPENLWPLLDKLRALSRSARSS
jgi:hypothetical protein